MARFIEFSSAQNSSAAIHFTGDWVLDNLTEIENNSRSSAVSSSAAIKADIGKLDTAGASLLLSLIEKYQIKDWHAIEGLTPKQIALLELVSQADYELPQQAAHQNFLIYALEKLGHTSIIIWHDFLDLLRFLGEATVMLGRTIINPAQLRFKSLTRHIREAGISAIPIVALIAFLISIVLAYQGANQLQRFGARIFTINLVAISVLREMGVLLTAVMIAGRSGSAFTAEIGVMKINEEVDALRIIGVQPFGFLVMPRVLALIITMPLLTFIADIMGLLGGGIVAYNLIDVPPEQYIERFRNAVKLSDFWVGIFKAPIFGFVIAVVGCMRGLQVSGSAESAGKLTTIAVVQSIFLVLLLDALFSVLFTELGI